MATELLATGADAANSTDLVVTAPPVTVSLKDAAGPDLPPNCVVDVQIKDDAGAYFTIGQLTTVSPARVITGPGTYRFARQTGGACGVFSG